MQQFKYIRFILNAVVSTIPAFTLSIMHAFWEIPYLKLHYYTDVTCCKCYCPLTVSLCEHWLLRNYYRSSPSKIRTLRTKTLKTANLLPEILFTSYVSNFFSNALCISHYSHSVRQNPNVLKKIIVVSIFLLLSWKCLKHMC